MDDNEVIKMLTDIIWAWVKETSAGTERLADLDAGDVVWLALDIHGQWPGRGGEITGRLSDHARPEASDAHK